MLCEPDMVKKKVVRWRVHTPRLLQEILNNSQVAMLNAPIGIFAGILAEVSDRAIQLNDPIMSALMVRLALFSVADPYSEDYDKDVVDEVLRSAYGEES